MTQPQGEFSHLFYDDLTETLFFYFNEATIQDLSGKQEEQQLEEFCVWVQAKDLEKIKKAINDTF